MGLLIKTLIKSQITILNNNVHIIKLNKKNEIKRSIIINFFILFLNNFSQLILFKKIINRIN